ncbi:MAG: hypothetical protein WD601_09190, partial [Pseudohongiellaceae bacterium]
QFLDGVQHSLVDIQGGSHESILCDALMLSHQMQPGKRGYLNRSMQACKEQKTRGRLVDTHKLCSWK